MEKKEAMKILKDFHDKSALFSVRTALDTIIPELKESKDERIRKKLLSSFKDIMADADEDELWYGLPYNDIISWLEKQGESYTKKDVDDAYLKGVTDTKNEIEKQYEANYQIRKDIATFIFNYRGDIKDRAKWMNFLDIKVSFVEEQDDKPQGKSALEAVNEEKVDNANKVEPKFRIGDFVKNTNYQGEPIYEIVYIDKECYICEYRGKENMGDKTVMHFAFDNPYLRLVEQKPAWSEEDENLFRCAIDAVEQESKVRTDGCLDEEVGGMVTDWLKSIKDRVQPKQEWSEEDKNMLQSILDEYKSMPTEKRNWLKSLKERVQPQLKQEWNEEDETYSDHVITAIKSYYTDDLGEENLWREELLRWLKSLRPQSTWKPSEEQMKALNTITVTGGISYAGQEQTLINLYNDLKKLKG